ncbi:hypothetical protein, partial [Methylobacterium sp. E-046]|uniref:hypothetical protein n=1 Tax=Methylobacterium sp. E-046 TaxID=2836576 RepID=UPI001FBA7D1D
MAISEYWWVGAAGCAAGRAENPPGAGMVVTEWLDRDAAAEVASACPARAAAWPMMPLNPTADRWTFVSMGAQPGEAMA